MANTPQNYSVLGQAPLDAKLIFKNEEDLKLLIAKNPIIYAFNFYKGMRVYFQDEEKMYIWENPFSEYYKENKKLLETNYIYPEGANYEDLDYSNKAFNFIELPERKESIGIWNPDDDEKTIVVEIFEGSNVNSFDAEELLEIWPNTQKVSFIGGDIIGIKLLGQPISLYQEFDVSDWNNLTYDIWNNSNDFSQVAKIRLLQPGEVIDYTIYENQILGNAFKEIRIIHSDNDLKNPSSVYFRPNEENSFEVVVVDKLNQPRTLKGVQGPPGPKGTAASISLGTVNTLEPNQNVIITNSGTIDNAIFNFSIPKGKPGIDAEPIYNDPNDTLAVDTIKRIDIETNSDVNYKETTTWYDGTPMDNSKEDGRFYKKIDGKFYVSSDIGDDWTFEMFGGKADGVFDNSPILDYMLSLPFFDYLKVEVKSTTKPYYFSRAMNFRKRVIFEGVSNGMGIGTKTVFLIGESHDGLVVNRHDTNGYHKQVAAPIPFSTAEGSSFKNISVFQKNDKGSFSAYDINPDIGRAVGITWHGLFPTNTPLKMINNSAVDSDGKQQVIGTANYLTEVSSTTRIVVVDADSSIFTIGQSVIWSGGSGTISYLVKDDKIIGIDIIAGDLYAGTIITVNSNQYTIFQRAERVCKVISLNNFSNNFPKNGVLIDQVTAGNGIRLMAKASFENCSINNFGYNGIYGLATFNILNCSKIKGVNIASPRLDGVFFSGGDSNASIITDLDIGACGGHSIFDESFLGNYYYGCHTSVFGLGAYKLQGFNNFGILSGCYTEGQPSALPLYNSDCEVWGKVRVIGGDYGSPIITRDLVHTKQVGDVNEGGRSARGTISRIETDNGGSMRFPEGYVYSGVGNVFDSVMTFSRNNNGDGLNNATFSFAAPSKMPVDKSNIRMAYVEGGVTSRLYDQQAGGIYFWLSKPAYNDILDIPNNSYIPLISGQTIRAVSLKTVIENGNLVEIKVLSGGENIKDFQLDFYGKLTGTVVKKHIVKGVCVEVKIVTPPTAQGTLVNTAPEKRLTFEYDNLSPNVNNELTLGTSLKRWDNIFSNKINISGLSIYANNSDAIAGGLSIGDLYKTASGDLKITI